MYGKMRISLHFVGLSLHIPQFLTFCRTFRKKIFYRDKLTTGTTTLHKHLKDQHQIDIPVRSVKKQRTITEIEPFDEQKQMEHTKYLVQWLICDLQPFTTVDNSYFRAFVSHFCPRYTMPERHQVKDLIIGGFNSRRTKIANELHQIEGQYSLMADMWTSMNRDAFLGITIHYIVRACNPSFLVY